jgi:transcriptional regulator with XRE-family HTH domain
VHNRQREGRSKPIGESRPVNGADLKTQFASNLRHLRRQAGLSQGDLGFRCELHPTAISLLERGGRMPRVDTVIKLAAALNVDPCELLRGMTWAPREPRARRAGRQP